MMPSSTTSETWTVIDGEGGAMGGGVSISAITSNTASGIVTSSSLVIQPPESSGEIELATANLASYAGPAQAGEPETPSESITSSAFDVLDENEQAEILAMGRLQRRAEYRAARAAGRSARRPATTRGRGSSVDSAVTGSFFSSDVQSLVADFDNLAVKAPTAASSGNRAITCRATVAVSSPPYNLAFARELAAFLRSTNEGTAEIRGLRGWQVLARAGGVTILSNSIPEIIRAIKAIFVNIYDVLEALESGRVATGFARAGELARYTFGNGRTMGKSQAKAKQMLKVFLKELS